jgi:DnaK suppressor protein
MTMMNDKPKSHLPADRVAQLQRALVQKRNELQAALSANEQTQLQPSTEAEAGDVAELIIEQDDAARAVVRETQLLADVERAIAKIDAGTYGFSEISGLPISIERLDAVPWARRTLEEEEALLRRTR